MSGNLAMARLVQAGPLKIWGEVTLGVRTKFGPEFAEGRLGPNKIRPARQACRAGQSEPFGSGVRGYRRLLGYHFLEMLMQKW